MAASPLRILITGANGFIGGHLVRLLKNDYRVHALVRNATEPHQAGVSVHAVDLATDWDAAQLPGQIDCVIHLAQSTRYRDFPEGAEDMRRVNIDSTAKLLDWARRATVRSFVFVSTANVYGRNTGLVRESQATFPESFYGASKLAAELLTQQYGQCFNVTNLRLFTVYGPGQRGMLFSNIIDRVRTGTPVALAKGTGPFLTPIFIDDVTHIIRSIMSCDDRRFARTLNVAGRETVDLGNVVKICEDLLGIKAKITVTEEEPLVLTGAIDELEKCIGNYQFVEIRDGLHRTVTADQI